jgi:hypothetical protein
VGKIAQERGFDPVRIYCLNLSCRGTWQVQKEQQTDQCGPTADPAQEAYVPVSAILGCVVGHTFVLS